MERTGAGDPVRVVPLLWRRGLRTGRKGLTLDRVVEAALRVADEVGIEQLSMRKLADELRVGTMTLYAHVPGRSELIDLMVDRVHGEVEHATPRDQDLWRQGLLRVAEANWAMYAAHPWLLDVDTTRPPLGPGTLAKYDAELRPLDQSGLNDIEIDQVLSLVLDHVSATARQAQLRAEPPGSRPDSDWWEQAGPLLAAFMDPAEYPIAARVGEAAGQEYGAPSDPQRAYLFGLNTILNGVAALIDRAG